MKNLELTQMELIHGSDTGGTITGFACGLALGLSAAVIIGTAGSGIIAGAYISGAACGGGIGWGLASGDWW